MRILGGAAFSDIAAGSSSYWVLFSLRRKVDAAEAVEVVARAACDGWSYVRRLVVVPSLTVLMAVCLASTVMVLLEKLFFGGVSLAVKALGLKPERRRRWEPMGSDLELGSSAYPLVLVQIPMYNEKEVYKKSIGAACRLEWPIDRMIIQVLDDSTDPTVKVLVVSECLKWKDKGLDIHYEIRDSRQGYKAGALKEGMKYSYVKNCDYVAMFDADFQPEPNFLKRAVPFLVHNRNVGLVQARWKFVNADECMLTRLQEMSLDYHFKIEQEASSSSSAFFGFNGTAGVWRISAIEDAGGWQDRTTVEDMDLAVRAGLRGWEFVYVGDIKVNSELPSTFKAYRFQQHRWSSGPANLFKKMAMEIALSENVTMWKKLYLLYSFFFVGKIVAHMMTFVTYCLLIPMCVLFPEVNAPLWGTEYVPLLITTLKAFGTPSSLHLVVFWILFENVMSLHRTKAALAGLLEVGRVNEWVVTEKLGDTLRTNLEADDADAQTNKPTALKETQITPRKRSFWTRFYLAELGMGVFHILCAICDLMYVGKGYYVYLFLQGIAFLVAGFGYVGVSVPS